MNIGPTAGLADWDEQDRYLSTDDEGNSTPSAKGRSKGQRAREEAALRAELARARQLAHERIGRDEQNRAKRDFALLDNVSEKESPSWQKRSRASGPHLDPALNPHIDHEAIEVGDSDSDLLHDDSSTTYSEEDSPAVKQPSLGKNCGQRARPARETMHRLEKYVGEDSDDDKDCTMYDDLTASRKVLEAQILAEERAKRRRQFCDSSSEDDPSECSSSCTSNATEDDDDEEEASLSSVVGGI